MTDENGFSGSRLRPYGLGGSRSSPAFVPTATGDYSQSMAPYIGGIDEILSRYDDGRSRQASVYPYDYGAPAVYDEDYLESAESYFDETGIHVGATVSRSVQTPYGTTQARASMQVSMGPDGLSMRMRSEGIGLGSRGMTASRSSEAIQYPYNSGGMPHGSYAHGGHSSTFRRSFSEQMFRSQIPIFNLLQSGFGLGPCQNPLCPIHGGQSRRGNSQSYTVNEPDDVRSHSHEEQTPHTEGGPIITELSDEEEAHLAAPRSSDFPYGEDKPHQIVEETDDNVTFSLSSSDFSSLDSRTENEPYEQISQTLGGITEDQPRNTQASKNKNTLIRKSKNPPKNKNAVVKVLNRLDSQTSTRTDTSLDSLDSLLNIDDHGVSVDKMSDNFDKAMSSISHTNVGRVATANKNIVTEDIDQTNTTEYQTDTDGSCKASVDLGQVPISTTDGVYEVHKSMSLPPFDNENCMGEVENVNISPVISGSHSNAATEASRLSTEVDMDKRDHGDQGAREAPLEDTETTSRMQPRPESPIPGPVNFQEQAYLNDTIPLGSPTEKPLLCHKSGQVEDLHNTDYVDKDMNQTNNTDEDDTGHTQLQVDTPIVFPLNTANQCDSYHKQPFTVSDEDQLHLQNRCHREETNCEASNENTSQTPTTDEPGDILDNKMKSDASCLTNVPATTPEDITEESKRDNPGLEHSGCNDTGDTELSTSGGHASEYSHSHADKTEPALHMTLSPKQKDNSVRSTQETTHTVDLNEPDDQHPLSQLVASFLKEDVENTETATDCVQNKGKDMEADQSSRRQNIDCTHSITDKAVCFDENEKLKEQSVVNQSISFKAKMIDQDPVEDDENTDKRFDTPLEATEFTRRDGRSNADKQGFARVTQAKGQKVIVNVETGVYEFDKRVTVPAVNQEHCIAEVENANAPPTIIWGSHGNVTVVDSRVLMENNIDDDGNDQTFGKGMAPLVTEHIPELLTSEDDEEHVTHQNVSGKHKTLHERTLARSLSPEVGKENTNANIIGMPMQTGRLANKKQIEDEPTTPPQQTQWFEERANMPFENPMLVQYSVEKDTVVKSQGESFRSSKTFTESMPSPRQLGRSGRHQTTQNYEQHSVNRNTDHHAAGHSTCQPNLRQSSHHQQHEHRPEGNTSSTHKGECLYCRIQPTCPHKQFETICRPCCHKVHVHVDRCTNCHKEFTPDQIKEIKGRHLYVTHVFYNLFTIRDRF